MFLKRKFYFPALIILLGLVVSIISGCSLPSSSTTYADNPVAGRETLTQVSTINALLAGVYDGIIPSGKLKGYGDFGIGTFEAVDGEMVVLDGQVYQVKYDGVAYPAPDLVTVPFAAVTFFDKEQAARIAPGLNYAQLQESLDKVIPSVNSFYAIQIKGSFSYIKTRSIAKQVKPYPPLTTVTGQQSVFEFNNIAGTIVGFRCPQYVNGVNVPGYHLHFLTEDRQAGGHLLELNTGDDTVWLDDTPGFLMLLPDQKSDFYKINLSGDQQSNLNKVEK